MAMADAMTQAETSGTDIWSQGHGGRIDAAADAYPDAPLPWIDLSTGINPLPWQAPADLAIDAAPLPTPSALRALEAAAAHHFGVAPDRVAAVPGSEVALRLLPALGLPRLIVAAAPTYGTHAAVADGSIAREAISGSGGGTLLLANPNNPDGLALSAAAMRAIVAARARLGGWTVVDEAFVDATPECSVLSAVDDTAPLVVTRSFGKFFGLAGVRLGFVVAAPPIIARVRHLLGDWPVGAQAIAWGQAAYADADWIAATRRALTARAARLDALLAAHDLVATGDCPLFRLVARPDARRVFASLARAGILTRPFSYRGDWLRFGLPADDAAFARLDRALADG